MTLEQPRRVFAVSVGPCPQTRPMTEWMVTANLGGSYGGSSARNSAMTSWGERVLASRQPAIAFIQELPYGNDSWLGPWTAVGYRVTFGVDRGWRVRSALVTRPDVDIEPLTEAAVPNLSYHGNYLATAKWNSASGAVVLASVHASPQKAEPERYGWQGEVPAPRDGGGDPRYSGRQLWDSDLVLATLGELARAGHGRLLAAGDFNESLDFDRGAGATAGTWGKEYFDRARAAGLVPWLHEHWGGRTTHSQRPAARPRARDGSGLAYLGVAIPPPSLMRRGQRMGITCPTTLRSGSPSRNRFHPNPRSA